MRNVSIDNAAIGAMAAALLFVVLFWQLGTPTFWDPDEAHYAETSREVLRTGDWWAPYYNEQPFFDKPILFHQLQATAMRIVSDPELGARLVPALAALALIGVTYWFAAAAVSRDVAIVAALLLGANPAVFGLARYAIFDTVLTLFTFGGAAVLAVSALKNRRRLQWVGYVALAIGVTVKGPLALALSGLTMIVLLIASPDLRRRLLGLNWVLGLLLVLALSLPWFIYMYLRFRQDFMNGYVLDENVMLFVRSRFANQPGRGFYLQILALGLLPWTGLVVGRIVDDVRAVGRGERLDDAERMLWAWTFAVVAFFTASSFKLDHYIFPAVPALCILCARGWTDLRLRHRDPSTAASRYGLLIVGPLVLVFGLAAGYALTTRLALPPAAIGVAAAVALAGAAITLRINLRGAPPPRVPWLATGTFIAIYSGIILFVMPALEARKVVPEMARWVASHAQPSDRVCSYRLNRWTPSYRFYVDRHVEMLEDPAEAEAFFGGPRPFYCVMRDHDFHAFAARGAKLRVLLEREGMAVTSGRALFRAPQPPARYVVVAQAR